MERYELLTAHCRLYPQLTVADVLKFVYQSVCGCEHAVSSWETAAARIREEYASVCCEKQPLIDELDGCYSRVSLAYLSHGLHAETLAKLFAMSAQAQPNAACSLKEKLAAVEEMTRKGMLPFSSAEWSTAATAWEAEGFPPPRHSDEFRAAYQPCYRVIDNRYVPFLPMLAKLDSLLSKQPCILAVDGRSAAGKTTLSETLQTLYDCTVFHMDDFFLRPEQRTAERYAEAGGNIDRERFLEEVLTPLAAHRPVTYRRFNCASQTLEEPITVTPKRLTVIEGVYSLHPAFREAYDLCVYLDIDPALQRQRITRRNSPSMAERFFAEWVPLEERYFSAMAIAEHSDCCIKFTTAPIRVQKKS